MARETLPGSPQRGELDADLRDLELDITRERLDGAPLTGWRAPLAAWAERASGWLGAPATPPTMPAAPPPTMPAARGDAPHSSPAASSAASSRQAARWRLLRQGMVALLVAATLFALLDGVDATRAALGALDHALHPPRPLPALSSGEYTLKNLPPRAQHSQHITIAPAAGDPASAYICWVDLYGADSATQGGPLFLYRTANGGGGWQPAGAPALRAVDCGVTTDSVGGPGALLNIAPGYTLGGLCEPPRLFLTLDGQSWREVSWPGLSFSAPCGVQYALVGGAIYVWSADRYASGALPFSDSGRLIVSRDAGASWANADSGLSDGAGLDVVGLQLGGRILVTVPDVRGAPGSVMLEESTDYGVTWRDLGDPPGSFGTVYASSDPARQDDWGRLYALAHPAVIDSAAPDSYVMATTARAGTPWTLIPLPPFLAGDDRNPDVTTPAILGVGPRDALFVERGAVPVNSRDVLSLPRRVWAWLPGQREWALDPQPSFGNIDDLAWGWSHGAWTAWVTSLQLGVPPTLHLFTRSYAAADLVPTSG